MYDWAFEKRIWSLLKIVRMSLTALPNLSEKAEGISRNFRSWLHVDHGFQNLFQWCLQAGRNF